MDQWVFWGVTFAFTTMVGVIIHNARKANEIITKAIEELSDRMDKVEEKYTNLVAQMPLNYTLRDDFIRSMSGVEAKLNKILDRLPAGKGEC